MIEQQSKELSNDNNLRNLVEEHFDYRLEKNTLSSLVDSARGNEGRRIREIAEISCIGAEEVEETFQTVFDDVFMTSNSRDVAHKTLGEVYEETNGNRMRLASITLNTLWDMREKSVNQTSY